MLNVKYYLYGAWNRKEKQQHCVHNKHDMVHNKPVCVHNEPNMVQNNHIVYVHNEPDMVIFNLHQTLS